MEQQKTSDNFSFSESETELILYSDDSKVVVLDKQTGKIITYYLVNSISDQDWDKYFDK
jgi:hypothetical protein